jgi:hypothetical protein
LICQRGLHSETENHIGGGFAITCSSIGGDVDFSSTIVNGSVQIINSRIGANLHCGCKIEGLPTFRAKEIVLRGSRIEGFAALLSSEIEELTVFRTEFEDGLFLAGPKSHFLSEYMLGKDSKIKRVVIEFSHVGCMLVIGDSMINVNGTNKSPGTNSPVNAAYWSRFVFAQKKMIIWIKEKLGELRPSDIRLRLSHTTTGKLVFGVASRPRMDINGLKWQSLEIRDQVHTNYVRLLEDTVFLVGNYTSCERHLRDEGKESEADCVFLAMHRRERRIGMDTVACLIDIAIFDILGAWLLLRRPEWRGSVGELIGRFCNRWKTWKARSWPTKLLQLCIFPFSTVWKWIGHFWNWLLDLLTGNGTSTQRLVVYLVFCFVGMTIVFIDDRSVTKATVATAGDMNTNPTMSEKRFHPSETGGNWQLGDAMFMAARVTVPVVDLVFESDWEPSDNSTRISWLTYTYLANGIGLLNYLMVPLFLVSLSGWLKKRGE